MDNNWLKIIILTLVFCVFSSISVVLTGSRDLISGDIFQKFFKILLDWRFILAFVLSVASRFIFILINNALLSVPNIANSSTTITVFITSLGYFFVVVLNVLFLHETMTLRQWGGALLVVLGVVLITS